MKSNQFKQFVEYVTGKYSENTVDPKEIVQQMAIVIGIRLSHSNRLPASCGKGLNIDMDIIQEGLLLGLELLPKFDAEKGNLRQFLYKHMAGRMHRYAWRRENRIGDSVGRSSSAEVLDVDSYDIDGSTELVDGLSDGITPESEMLEAEESAVTTEALRKALAGLSPEDRTLLVKATMIGRNKPARDALARSLDVSPETLAKRVQRARDRANIYISLELSESVG